MALWEYLLLKRYLYDLHDIIDKFVTDRNLKHFIFYECFLWYLSDHIWKQWDEIVNWAHNYDAIDSL